MTLPLWLDDASDALEPKTEERYDVVIIGGGVIGAGCAYILSQRQNLKVAIVESGKLAHGSSGRNGGFVLRGIQTYYNNCAKLYGRQTAAQIFRFAEQNQQLIKEFKEKYGNCFDYEACGSYLLACSLEELEELAESAQMMREDGFDLEFLKEDPLERDYYGAMVNPGDVGINPVKFVRALAAASTAKIFEDETVVRIEYEGCVAVQTATRTLKCDKVFTGHKCLYAASCAMVRGQDTTRSRSSFSNQATAQTDCRQTLLCQLRLGILSPAQRQSIATWWLQTTIFERRDRLRRHDQQTGSERTAVIFERQIPGCGGCSYRLSLVRSNGNYCRRLAARR